MMGYFAYRRKRGLLKLLLAHITCRVGIKRCGMRGGHMVGFAILENFSINHAFIGKTVNACTARVNKMICFYNWMTTGNQYAAVIDIETCTDWNISLVIGYPSCANWPTWRYDQKQRFLGIRSHRSLLGFAAVALNVNRFNFTCHQRKSINIVG